MISQHPTPRQLAKWRGMTWADRLASWHYARAKAMNGGKPNGWWKGSWWLDLIERADHCCVYCGAYCPKLSPDHIVPLSRGGTNDLWNIAPCCPDCQGHKSNKPPDQWFAEGELEALMAQLHPTYHVPEHERAS